MITWSRRLIFPSVIDVKNLPQLSTFYMNAQIMSGREDLIGPFLRCPDFPKSSQENDYLDVDAILNLHKKKETF